MALGKRAVQGGFEKGTAQAEEERVRPDRRCKAAYMHMCIIVNIIVVVVFVVVVFVVVVVVVVYHYYYLSLLSSIIIIIIIIHEYIYVYMNM